MTTFPNLLDALGHRPEEAYREKLAAYRAFLAAKTAIEPLGGFPCEPSEVHPALYPHQRDMVAWAVRGGRRALFSAFGLGKTLVQIETLRLTLLKSGAERGNGGRALVVLPLGVKAEFERDAALVGMPVRFVRLTEEVRPPDPEHPCLYLTNYESVRDGRLDPTLFDALSLDEASALRGMGGTKTFRAFMALFEHSAMPRFVATATPSPNEFVELLAYAAFLGIMDVGQAKTRFFKRDSSHADRLTIHPHKEREFWLWCASWALFVSKPSDLGPRENPYSDEGYALPPLEIVWHVLPSAPPEVPEDRYDGQLTMFRDAALGVVSAAREKRSSLDDRVERCREIVATEPGRPDGEPEHWLLWHDLEDERRAIERAFPPDGLAIGARSVWGSQPMEEREETVRLFAEGKLPILAAKPVMLGSGTNLQRHCARAVFLGIGFKFNDFIQAVHRLQRFGQSRPVTIHLVHTEAEDRIKADLLRKWSQHEEAAARMAGIVREFGLASSALSGGLGRTVGVEERIEGADDWALLNADCVEATLRLPDDAITGMVLTSIPFSSQYEYTPSYNDFGHTDDNAHFWSQMDHLTPEILRALAPGRVCAVHVKDRITPGGINGLGFQTVTPFSDECVAHFVRHGWAFLSRVTIATDVVRENAQTYRLGWSEQGKDGSRMGNGLPEYLLVFRKPPTDLSNGYADIPVVKDKVRYTRARWQLDAAGFWRSSGDRLLSPEDLAGLDHRRVWRRWKSAAMEEVYGFESHVAILEALDARGMLPPSFSIAPVHQADPDGGVWSDVMRARTLNTDAQRMRREAHLCPLQLDVVDRCVTRYTMPGEIVYDPFSGVGTVAARAVRLGRMGLGTELNPGYWESSVGVLRALGHAEILPTLFDVLALEADDDPLEDDGEEVPAEIAAMPTLAPPDDPPEWRLTQQEIPIESDGAPDEPFGTPVHEPLREAA